MAAISRRTFLPLAATTLSLGWTAPMPQLAFQQWDVFTTRKLTGNPLAVFTDARGLSDSQMLAIAKEMNLSETTFIFRRAAQIEAEHGIQVRIFTTTQELPFAGHPTLGTALSLRQTLGRQLIHLDLKAGKVPVTFTDGPDGFPIGEMRQPEPLLLESHAIADVAPLLGLAPDDLDATVPIQTVSTGRPKTLVLIKSLAAIQRVQMNWPAIKQYFAKGDPQRGFYLLTHQTVDSQAHFHARYPGPSNEDPVTGSAAGCAAAWFVATGLVKPDEHVMIEQGLEIQRPGRMIVAAALGATGPTNVRVAGTGIQVMAGTLTL